MARIVMESLRSRYDSTTPGVDRKFNERDLMIYPELLPLAVDYAKKYVGDFNFMLDAKDMALSMGTLPLHIAKAVLNCARADPSINISVEYDDDEDEGFGEGVVVPFPEREAPKPEPEPEPYVRKYILRTKARIKAPFGMSSAPGGKGRVVHRIRPGSAYFDWPWEQSGDKWWRDRDPRPTDRRGAPELRVDWVCGSGYPRNPLLLFERPEGVGYCRSGCFARPCKTCGHMNTLNNDEPLDAELAACRKCGTKL